MVLEVILLLLFVLLVGVDSGPIVYHVLSVDVPESNRSDCLSMCCTSSTGTTKLYCMDPRFTELEEDRVLPPSPHLELSHFDNPAITPVHTLNTSLRP